MNRLSALFICKNREHPTSGGYHNGDFSSGLYNSASYASKMLATDGIPSMVVHVGDNNGIDREVTIHNPTHVFIEALWVVPEKFDILAKLHPDVTWVIRIHSELPFIANEGIATQWLFQYVRKSNVYVAFNSKNIYDDFRRMVEIKHERKVLYLPNHYVGEKSIINKSFNRGMDIGCFGAIRPMKNQLIQAVAAIEFAHDLNTPLRFHINGTRVEQKGDSVIKNIRHLFANVTGCELVEHPWMNHTDFVKLVSSMDINMQVSLSETFNIVTADAVVNGTPVVVSSEINWICWPFRANPTSTKSIKTRLMVAHLLGTFGLHVINEWKLKRYNRKAKRLWLQYLRHPM
jgi:hypothetical protein